MVKQPEETSPTPEEIKKEIQEEDELLKESKEDEVRTQIIEKHGLDEEADADLIKTLTEEKLADRKSFGKLVGQKRKKRIELEELKKKPEGETQKDTTPKGEEKEKYLTQKDLDERDMKRDLDSLEVSDELKKEVESYANLHDVLVKEAFKSSYIQFQKKGEDDKKQEEAASAGGDGGTRAGKDYSKMSPKDFDLQTEDGRKDYKVWKKETGRVDDV